MRQRIEKLSPSKRALVRKLVIERLNPQPTQSPAQIERLVAYLVCEKEDDETIDNVRNALSQRLPEFMVPSQFVVLDELPLTPNGKVDRRALPDPHDVMRAGSVEFVSPRTDAERALAEIWAHVLGIDEVGVNDNFFELGGQSLLVNQVVARIGEVFGVDLSLRALFEAATIAELALVVEEALISELEALPEPMAEGSTGQDGNSDERTDPSALAGEAVSGQAGIAGRAAEGKTP